MRENEGMTRTLLLALFQAICLAVLMNGVTRGQLRRQKSPVLFWIGVAGIVACSAALLLALWEIFAEL